jgi:hypothetical protein
VTPLRKYTITLYLCVLIGPDGGLCFKCQGPTFRMTPGKPLCRIRPGIRLGSLMMLAAGLLHHATLGAAIDDSTAKAMPPNIILMLADDLG